MQSCLTLLRAYEKSCFPIKYVHLKKKAAKLCTWGTPVKSLVKTALFSFNINFLYSSPAVYIFCGTWLVLLALMWRPINYYRISRCAVVVCRHWYIVAVWKLSVSDVIIIFMFWLKCGSDWKTKGLVTPVQFICHKVDPPQSPILLSSFSDPIGINNLQNEPHVILRLVS